MGVYKEGKNWKVQVYYKDWQGNRKRKQKRGFRTKGEAVFCQALFPKKSVRICCDKQ